MQHRVLLAGLALLLGTPVLLGCGGDDEPEPPPRPPAEVPTPPSAKTEPTEPDEEDPRERPTPPTGGAPAPRPPEEEKEGGAGDEEPIASDAVVVGRGGRVHPPVVTVPPFIAIRLELRAGDGRRYELEVAGETLVAGAPAPDRASATLDGLTPGRSYVGRVRRGSATVRIVASSEPGG